MRTSLSAVLAALALALTTPACGLEERASAAEEPNEAHALVDNGALLLDVRTREEYAAGHVEGAVNIPVQELGARMNEVGDPQRPIVVYCQSGRRSAAATEMLRAAGHVAVHDLGPMSAW